MKKRILSILLCLCMAACMLPTVAFAADTGKAIQLGTSGISDPVKTTVENFGVYWGDYWTPSDYIYFGVNSANSNTPIKWQVLDADKANDGTTDGIFLLSEFVGIRCVL